MSIEIPYLRKGISSTLIALSAAFALLLLASPLLPLSNFLLQPVLAQTPVSFLSTTTKPAIGTLCTGPKDGAAITFDAHGTFSDAQDARITSGTFQVTDSSTGQILYSGSIAGGTFTNNTSGGFVFIGGSPNHFPNTPHTCAQIGDTLSITTNCSTADYNSIDVSGSTVDNFGDFRGAVECSVAQGHTTQSSSSPGTTTTTQDSDGDGIPDSSDKCASNSNHRCYKESKE